VNLDRTKEDFRNLLYQTADYIVDFYESIPDRKTFPGDTPEIVRAMFDGPLPKSGTPIEEILKTLIPQVYEASTLSISPRFFGYIISGGTQIGIAAEMLSAALNANHTKWHLAPAAAEIERLVIRWINDFIGYRRDAGGIMVSGGSMANLTCLMVARLKAGSAEVSTEGLFSSPKLLLYASTEAHSCIEKSMDMLGLGRKQVRKIPVKENLTIQIDALERAIQQDIQEGHKPFCIVGNAGTVNSGAVDDLNALADLAKRYQIWLHVDGAYGGPASATPLTKEMFRGLEHADSLAFDPHKWLQVPFEAGCALVRSWKDLQDTYSLIPDYLRSEMATEDRFDYFEHGFQLSRNFKALKVWLTFLAYGADRLRKVIEDNILIMRHLGRLIEGTTDFELLAPVTLSIASFRYRPAGVSEHVLDEINLLLAQTIESDGHFFLTSTRIHGKVALRACCINHRADEETVEELLHHVGKLARSLSIDSVEGSSEL
jgi:aromatic-L-amino-acid/L-tryptophan decarboxylase